MARTFWKMFEFICITWLVTIYGQLLVRDVVHMYGHQQKRIYYAQPHITNMPNILTKATGPGKTQ